MLEIREAMYKGKPVSVFLVTRNQEPLDRSLSDVTSRLRERFRCGDSPRPGHTPLIGQIAFVKATANAQPALAALTHELGSLFNVICVQSDPDRYAVSVVRDASAGCALGDTIAIAEVKEHPDPWSTP